MTIEATVNDLVASVSALTNSVATKRAVLDTAASNADTSAVTAVNSANAAAASAAAAAAKATEATNNATQIAAYKTAAAALNTTTTASAAVAAQAADAMARFDPARHTFRNKLPSLVLDFGRQSAHKYSPLTGLVRQAITDVVTFTRNSTASATLASSKAGEAAADADYVAATLTETQSALTAMAISVLQTQNMIVNYHAFE